MMKRQLTIGILSHVILGLSGLIFVYAFVNNFGKERYALFSIVFSVAAAALNLDGLQKPTVLRYGVALGDSTAMARTAATVSPISSLTGMVAALLCAGMVNQLVQRQTAMADPQLIIVACVNVAVYVWLQFKSTPYVAFLIAAERSGLIQVSKTLSFLLMFGLAYGLMQLSQEPLLAVFGISVSALLNYLLLRHLAHLRFASRPDSYREYLKDYIAGLMFNGAVFLSMFIDKFFVSVFTPDVAADYMIPYEFFARLAVLSGIIGMVLMGRTVREFQACDNYPAAKISYAYTSVQTLVFIFFITVHLWLYGKPFLSLWVGDAMTEGMVSVYLLLALAFLLNSFGWLGFNLMIAKGCFKEVSWLYWGVPFVMVVSYLGFMKSYGVIGLAISVAASRLIDILLFAISMKVGGLRLLEFAHALRSHTFRFSVVLIMAIGICAITWFYDYSTIWRLIIAVIAGVLMMAWLYLGDSISRRIIFFGNKFKKL